MQSDLDWGYAQHHLDVQDVTDDEEWERQLEWAVSKSLREAHVMSCPRSAISARCDLGKSFMDHFEGMLDALLHRPLELACDPVETDAVEETEQTKLVTDGGEEVGRAIARFEAPETSQVTTFETDELTALCPFDFGGPDHYDLTIRYVADEHCLESKSLKLWLESYRDQEITAEDLADELYRDINGAIAPERLYVRLEQARRGGIEETVEVGDRALC